MQVKYVVMPISIEQKKEYNRQGFRVVDARFAPADTEIETPVDARFAPADTEIETPVDGVEHEVILQGEGSAPRARRQRRERDEG